MAGYLLVVSFRDLFVPIRPGEGSFDLLGVWRLWSQTSLAAKIAGRVFAIQQESGQ